MRILTDAERTVLVEVGMPGECAPGEAFVEMERLGYGEWRRPHWWSRKAWYVTAAGRKALELDTIARTTP